MKALSKVALVATGSIIAGVIFLLAVIWATDWYLESQSNFRFSLHNVSGARVSEAYVVVSGSDLYCFGPIEPGQIVEGKFPPPQEISYVLIVEFPGGPVLYLTNPVYSVPGDESLVRFEIRAHEIRLIDHE